jgi:hypothetical protein
VGALFKKELERRQISSVDDIVDAPSGSGRRGGFSTPPPDYARTATDSQLERSRALNSEGLVRWWRRAHTRPPAPRSPPARPRQPPLTPLPTNAPRVDLQEGLIPRVTELVKLGGSFFLAFGPFIVGVALAFACVYAVFGSSFVHSGRPSAGPPTYIDPIELLNEPTIDPMVPL